MTPKTDPVRRAIRTLMMLVTAAIPVVPAVAQLFDVPAGRVAQIVGAFVAIGSALTFIWNALEDNTKFPALFKAPPSTGQNPTPDPTPTQP